jgi:WD40 repeat protein
LKISSSGLYTYEFHTKESHKAKYTCDKVIISISNLSEKYKTTINYRKNCSESAIRQVQFHPNDAIVTILDRGNHITYWDIATGTMMCKTISLPTDNEYYTSPYLSFSPDGTNVMLTLYNADYGSCMIIPTPFKVKHAHQLPYFLLLLQNINQHDQLPAEVACLIMQELLKL